MIDPDSAAPQAPTAAPLQLATPPPPPRRRVSVRLEIEADSLQIARESLARASSRFSVGAAAWSENSQIASGDLVVETEPGAPTGAKYEAALERWKESVAEVAGESSRGKKTARPR